MLLTPLFPVCKAYKPHVPDVEDTKIIQIKLSIDGMALKEDVMCYSLLQLLIQSSILVNSVTFKRQRATSEPSMGHYGLSLGNFLLHLGGHACHVLTNFFDINVFKSIEMETWKTLNGS